MFLKELVNQIKVFWIIFWIIPNHLRSQISPTFHRPVKNYSNTSFAPIFFKTNLPPCQTKPQLTTKSPCKSLKLKQQPSNKYPHLHIKIDYGKETRLRARALWLNGIYGIREIKTRKNERKLWNERKGLFFKRIYQKHNKYMG